MTSKIATPKQVKRLIQKGKSLFRKTKGVKLKTMPKRLGQEQRGTKSNG